ncbi:MAG: hypothetical protein GY821_03060, partial [Gammaproteobacteria bacterium]|nr:hypothetical protein [Gammaproteobacteria bacterium]
NTITWQELHENGAANGLKPENGQLLQEFEAIKTAILKATSKRGHTQRSIYAKPVLIINPKTKQAYLFAYDGEEWVQLEPFDCEDAPDVIKQGWKKNKRQVTITTQADRDFIEGDERNLIKVFEHNNWRWWTLAVIKQLAGLPLRIAVRWPLLALEYVLTGSTDLWPWQEEVEDNNKKTTSKKSRKQRSKKRVVTRRLADCILYTGAFFIGWPIILVRAVLKGIFITPFSHYQILKSEREPLGIVKSEVRQSHSIFLRMFFENIQPVTRHYGAPWGAY